MVQTGDAKVEGRSEKNGYVPEGKDAVRTIPLEVYVNGDKEPIYSATFDDVRRRRRRRAGSACARAHDAPFARRPLRRMMCAPARRRRLA